MTIVQSDIKLINFKILVIQPTMVFTGLSKTMELFAILKHVLRWNKDVEYYKANSDSSS